MEKINEDCHFSLSEDCLMMKLDSDILEHCDVFSCGNQDLDDFFSNDAISYENALMGKTYCWLLREDDRQIVGMITIL